MLAVVGLGSNVGDREGHLAFAEARLASSTHLLTIHARSRVYETTPWGDVPQGPYLNAALLIDWVGTPRALLAVLLDVEREAGRVRNVRYGPRTLDLDVLWIDGIVYEDNELRVPHPRLTERNFALLPLLDVAPFARDPVTSAPYLRPGQDGVLAVWQPISGSTWRGKPATGP